MYSCKRCTMGSSSGSSTGPNSSTTDEPDGGRHSARRPTMATRKTTKAVHEVLSSWAKMPTVWSFVGGRFYSFGFVLMGRSCFLFLESVSAFSRRVPWRSLQKRGQRGEPGRRQALTEAMGKDGGPARQHRAMHKDGWPSRAIVVNTVYYYLQLFTDI